MSQIPRWCPKCNQLPLFGVQTAHSCQKQLLTNAKWDRPNIESVLVTGLPLGSVDFIIYSVLGKNLLPTVDAFSQFNPKNHRLGLATLAQVLLSSTGNRADVIGDCLVQYITKLIDLNLSITKEDVMDVLCTNEDEIDRVLVDTTYKSFGNLMVEFGGTESIPVSEATISDEIEFESIQAPNLPVPHYDGSKQVPVKSSTYKPSLPEPVGSRAVPSYFTPGLQSKINNVTSQPHLSSNVKRWEPKRIKKDD
jgi:hypothetical protein